ncbi:hypothetical protein [Rhizorhabdus argentea]|uniref:hypothetical protein n=1 Tax=Rhizorhabdus argentea TaxID=1387174 RepID=UPI0030EC6091
MFRQFDSFQLCTFSGESMVLASSSWLGAECLQAHSKSVSPEAEQVGFHER